MGNAKWWVCDDCKSLNDVPAKKCYNCRTKRPANPTLIDDRYSQVKTKGRVSVTVDRSMVAALVARGPSETARKSSFDDVPDVVGGVVPGAGDTDTAMSMREPPKRSIAALGGRAWARLDRQAGSSGKQGAGASAPYRASSAPVAPGTQPVRPGTLPAGNAPPSDQLLPPQGSTQRPAVPPALARSVPPPPPGSLPLPPPPPPLARQQPPPLDEALVGSDVPEPRHEPERSHEDLPDHEFAKAGADQGNADDGNADDGNADHGNADHGNADDE